MKKQTGITLIALVITIIVILILAGVTVVTLKGDNGLLQKTGSAKNNVNEAEIEEEIRLAWNKVYADSHLENLSTEQKAGALQTELIGKDYSATVTASGNELKIKYRGKDKVLDISTGTLEESISAVVKAKKDGTIFNEDNTPITDEFGNTFIVPKGFKIASDSADNVTEGIVIEDATYRNTIGSQFVWIPISKDSSDTNKIKGSKDITILLSRYTFDDEGNPTDQGDNTINSYYNELSSSSYGNKVAKNINAFKSKTKAAGGFWIGRYEARKNSSNKVTEVVSDEIYNYIYQPNAAIVAREMYDRNDYFEVDLVNSYAWDTAILFLQEYDNRTGSGLKKYSIQTSLNSNLSTTGTTTDKICNIYDMASNCYELSTESSSYRQNFGAWRRSPAVSRGGSCGDISMVSSQRDRTPIDREEGYSSFSFRPVIYIN